MKLKILLIFFLILTTGFATQATTTSTTASDLKKKAEGDLDNEITNAKLRADSGSKSKYSASIKTKYKGGSIEDPGADFRLNLQGGDTQEQVDLSIEIKGRYRLNKNTSISAGIGTNIVQPFHGNRGDQSKYIDKIEVADPELSISKYERKGNWMLNYSIDLVYFTSEQATAIGRLMKPALNGTLLYEFKNGFQAGLGGDLGYNIIDGTDKFSSKTGELIDIADVTIALFPFFEYAINDRYSLRTVFNAGINHSRYSFTKGSRWKNSKTSQSIGLGIAVTRDIFLYPNIRISNRNFYDDASFERSTVEFKATINAF